MASLFSTVPVIDALDSATTRLLGYEVPWDLSGPSSFRKVLYHYSTASLKAAAALGEDVFSVAAHEVDTINTALSKAGFDMEMEDLGSGANMIYVASMMKLVREFKIHGKDGYFLPKTKKHGFRLGKEAGVLHFEYMDQHVVLVPTTKKLSLLIADFGDWGWRGVDFWNDVLTTMIPVKGNGVILPMIDVPETPTDVSELVGMRGGDWIILQALMASKFNLNPKGFDFQSAFAYSAGKGGMESFHPEEGDYVADHGISMAISDEIQPQFPIAWGFVPAVEF